MQVHALDDSRVNSPSEPHRLIAFSFFSRVKDGMMTVVLQSHPELLSSCRSLNAARCMLSMMMLLLQSRPHLTGRFFFVFSEVDHTSQVDCFFCFSGESSRVVVIMPVSKCSQVRAFDNNAGALESIAPHRLIVFSVFFSRVDHASQVDCFFKKLCSQWW